MFSTGTVRYGTVMLVPSKRVMSSPFLHKTISFSEFSVGDLMLYVAIKFDYKMSQMLVWPFLAFSNI